MAAQLLHDSSLVAGVRRAISACARVCVCVCAQQLNAVRLRNCSARGAARHMAQLQSCRKGVRWRVWSTAVLFIEYCRVVLAWCIVVLHMCCTVVLHMCCTGVLYCGAAHARAHGQELYVRHPSGPNPR